MATFTTTDGKILLFSNGWTNSSGIRQAKLYTSGNVLVDTQSISFTYNSQFGTIFATADVIFNVPSGTNNVAYIKLFETVTNKEIYSKDLPALYDFATAGTLTVDSWVFTLSSTRLLIDGKSALWQTGLESVVTWAKLYTSTNVLVNTQNVDFLVNDVTGQFEGNVNIIFNVPSGTNNINYVVLGYTSGTDVQLYKRIFSSNYNFATAGTLTISSWVIYI
jgi:hypothetical protein